MNTSERISAEGGDSRWPPSSDSSTSAGDGSSSNSRNPRQPDPTADEASQFALLLRAGVPPAVAISYLRADEPAEVQAGLAGWWASHSLVQDALDLLNGGRWHELTADQRIKLSLELHYAQLAYTLYTNHYDEALPAVRAKLDVCRRALEERQAGTSGQTGLSQFYAELIALKKRAVPKAPQPLRDTAIWPELCDTSSVTVRTS